MRSDDAYRGLIDDIARQLDSWAVAFRNLALIQIAREPDSLHVLSVPTADKACRFELSLRPDQFYDVEIGPETYEDLPVETSSMFRDLAIAISTGDVVRREIRSLVTGTIIAVETRVRLGTGALWVKSRAAQPSLAERVAFQDHHFLPYRERRAALARV